MILYAHAIRLTQNSTMLLNEIRNMLLHFNTPLLWMLWGILILVYLDIVNHITGSPLQYGFIISKLMLEAFFYSLFFAIWGDVLNQTSWRQRVVFIKSIKQNYLLYLQRLKHTKVKLQLSNIISFYFACNFFIIVHYASWTVSLCYAIISSFCYRYISQYMYYFACENNQVYAKQGNANNSDNFDAIIKWEYSECKKTDQVSNWILVQ